MKMLPLQKEKTQLKVSVILKS